MTIRLSQISNNQTFGSWLERTNQLANIVSSNTVTSDFTVGGSLTTGNVAVNGFFTTNTLSLSVGIRGGNNSTEANLAILSNTNIDPLSGNVLVITANGSAQSYSTTFTGNVVIINPSANTRVSGPLLTVNTTTFAVDSVTTFSNNTTFNSSLFFNSNLIIDTNTFTVDTVNNRIGVNVAIGSIEAGTVLDANGTIKATGIKVGSATLTNLGFLSSGGNNIFIIKNSNTFVETSANTASVNGYITFNIPLSNSTNYTYQLTPGALEIANAYVNSLAYYISGNASLGSVDITSFGVIIGNSSVTSNSQIVVANSQGNAVINTTSISVSNSSANFLTANNTGIFHSGSVNATSHTVGAYGTGSQGFIANSSTIGTGNSTVNTSITSSQLLLSNTTTNTLITIGSLYLGNTTANLAANSTSFFVGNSTVSSVVNSSGFSYNTGGVTYTVGIPLRVFDSTGTQLFP